MPGAGNSSLPIHSATPSNPTASLTPLRQQCRRLRLRNRHPLNHRRPLQGTSPPPRASGSTHFPSYRKSNQALTWPPHLQSNHHSMVGTTKDPENGPAVAGSVFAAVIVYVVRLLPSLRIHHPSWGSKRNLAPGADTGNVSTGLPRFLRLPGIFT